MQFKYDETSPEDILKYAQGLKDKTFIQLIKEAEANPASLISETYPDYLAIHKNHKHKGSLGEIIEECYFEYKANDNQEPDFPLAGVELKVSPFKINKNGTKSAKERLVITMIDYFRLADETFETSHLWDKSKLILLIYYLFSETVERLEYPIKYISLFTPPAEDLPVIKHDFEIIKQKVLKGKAHELSSADTCYLEACTKSSSSATHRKQPFSDIEAKPRAFAFKNSYMTYILNNYIIEEKKMYESIMPKESEDPFEIYVENKLAEYKGWSTSDLIEEFHIDTGSTQAKNLGAMLAYAILGVKSNKAEEFEKAGIQVKTIRIEANGRIKEHMSFPIIDFEALVNEEWDTSEFRNYLSDTKFLFVVYKFDEDGTLRLQGCQFWNIPYEDLEGDVQSVWLEMKEVLKRGPRISQAGIHRANDFPKQKDHPISHVRPHAANAKDTRPLPVATSEGDWEYTKQCFWLNNSYILSQLKDELKN